LVCRSDGDRKQMRSTYKSVFFLHALIGATYLFWTAFNVVFGFKGIVRVDQCFLAQIALAILLWPVIEKRLFVPAYYVACILTAITTYNFFVYGARQLGGFGSSGSQFLQYGLCMASIVFFIYMYMYLAFYPKYVMKTAKKLKLA